VYNGVNYQRRADIVGANDGDPFAALVFYGDETKPPRMMPTGRRNIESDANHLLSLLIPQARAYFEASKWKKDDAFFLGDTLISFNNDFELAAEAINKGFGEAHQINMLRRKSNADAAWGNMFKSTHALHNHGEKLLAKATLAKKRLGHSRKMSEVIKKQEDEAAILDKVRAGIKSGDSDMLQVAYDTAEHWASKQLNLDTSAKGVLQQAKQMLRQILVDSTLRQAYANLKEELETTLENKAHGVSDKLVLQTKSKKQIRKEKQAAVTNLMCAIRRGARQGATKAVLDEANWILWTCNAELNQQKERGDIVAELDIKAQQEGEQEALKALAIGE
jgi:hypothetical protein